METISHKRNRYIAALLQPIALKTGRQIIAGWIKQKILGNLEYALVEREFVSNILCLRLLRREFDDDCRCMPAFFPDFIRIALPHGDAENDVHIR